MIEVFMLLFNFTLTTPEGAPRQEIINVYSKHFETRIECTEFLDSWTSIIVSRGIDTLQDMLKEGYSVKLNNVSCAKQRLAIQQEEVVVEEEDHERKM
jgi:hypothetical protein